jgi:hypothetical protein
MVLYKIFTCIDTAGRTYIHVEDYIRLVHL